MTVLLSRAYAGYLTGTTVTLDAATESALVAQGLATVATTATTTTGPVTANAYSGIVSAAIGAASVVVTNPMVNASSQVFAVVAQAAADSTLVRVERVVCANGSFTIYGTAAATAATLIRWCLIPPAGLTPSA